MASVVVAGSVAQRPGRGGHAWVFLNYLLGLRELGHEVHFVDWLTADMVGSPAADLSRSAQAQWLDRVMRSFGFGADYSLIIDGVDEEDRSSLRAVTERLRRADLLLNVNGFLRDAELLDAPAVTAFVDIDPAIQQMWVALGLAELFAGHDLHFTVGENIGRASCDVPTCDLDWIPIRQPVALAEWPAVAPGRGFTTVASWRGPYGPIEYKGASYGLRVHEFRRLLGLAAGVDAELTVALDIDAEDEADAASLRQAGWKLRDPLEAAGTPDAYRAFIDGSYAEISVAKNVYVQSRCGWFSDRSACYLASGRPVLAQDTGYSDNLPTGVGLVSFVGVEEGVAGVEKIRSDWAAHSAAARSIAEEYFRADVVLKEMLDAAGV